ncbi:uncharacterized protein LOC114715614 [Neltuma alba]|uniref:uncharacterized protein LOC114715614 n=1 Tax=Neltuma alba TaxID=207710 RepID=UPI0010A48EB3|nr:uncharacterized protein LOC114715614 [Prosopis alba]
MIFDHYLAIQPWKPDFDPDAMEVTRIAAWVRIPKFPVDYYDLGILYVVGNQIGRVLKVDRNTLRHTKGRFARICVELDLNSPLLPSIFINGIEKKIVYEGLHSICFSCGKYGHESDHCPSHLQERTVIVECPKELAVNNNDTTAMATTSSVQSVVYGEWMVATRRRRPQRGQQLTGEKSGRESRRDNRSDQKENKGGSRFTALNGNDGDDTIEIPASNSILDPERDSSNGQKQQAKVHKPHKSNSESMMNNKHVENRHGPKGEVG